MATSAFFKWNRETRDKFIELRSDIKHILNEYISKSKKACLKLNDALGCDIKIPQELENTNDLDKFLEDVRMYVQTINSALSTSAHCLKTTIDPELVNSLNRMDMAFAEMARNCQIFAIASEAIASAVVGVGVGKYITSGSRIARWIGGYISPFGGALIAAGTTFLVLDVMSSLFINSNESTCLDKAITIYESFKKNEKQNIKSAGDAMEDLALEMANLRMRDSGEINHRSDCIGRKQNLRLSST